MRQCPRCQSALGVASRENVIMGILGPVNDGAVEVDECTACGGTFLDADEFGQLTANVGLEQFLTTGNRQVERGLPCPECGTAMTARSIGDVTVDACAECAGMWFDKGELEHLADVPRPDFGTGSLRKF